MTPGVKHWWWGGWKRRIVWVWELESPSPLCYRNTCLSSLIPLVALQQNCLQHPWLMAGPRWVCDMHRHGPVSCFVLFSFVLSCMPSFWMRWKTVCSREHLIPVFPAAGTVRSKLAQFLSNHRAGIRGWNKTLSTCWTVMVGSIHFPWFRPEIKQPSNGRNGRWAYCEGCNFQEIQTWEK